MANMDAEAKERLGRQEALIAEEEEEARAQTTKKKKSRKKKQGPGAAAALEEAGAAAAQEEAGAAEEAQVSPAPAPASKDDEQERGPRQTKKKNKKKPKASGGAASEAAAGAEPALESGDETALPSPPRASSECDAAGDCVVCLESPAQVAVIPCGHVCVCTECAQQQELCPICRAAVERMLRLFFSASH